MSHEDTDISTIDSEGKDERRVVHSDTISDSEDVVQLAKTQKRLLIITLIAGLIIFLVTTSFFLGLAEPSQQESQANNAATNKAEYSQGVYALRTDSNLELISHTPFIEQTDSTIKVEGNFTEVDSLVVSQDSKTFAFQSTVNNSTSIWLKKADKDLVEVVKKISKADLYNWVLDPSGGGVYTLTKSNGGELSLTYYNMSGAKDVVESNFGSLASGEQTDLIYTSDGLLRLYAITADNTINESIYDISTQKVTKQAILKPKISSNLTLAEQPVSPDGTFLLLKYQESNMQNYELVFLNSRTSTTIYSDQQLTHQAWLPNSLSISFLNQSSELTRLEVGPRTSEALDDVRGLENIDSMHWLDADTFVIQTEAGSLELVRESGKKTVQTALFDATPVKTLSIGRVIHYGEDELD